MEKPVKIYVLVDPFTMRVRYIGRTVRSLPMRLSQHVHHAKYKKGKTRRDSWIQSLLKVNSKPFIRLLCTVQGWKESYEFEKSLIHKYEPRILNHYDRGPGVIGVRRSEENRKQISEGLKRHFQTARNPACKRVYVYKEDGSFYKEYFSIREAAKGINVYFKTISKHINGISGRNTPTKDGRPRFLRTGFQFSLHKVEKMKDYTNKEERYCRSPRELGDVN